jgi:hypothetical protein
MPTDKTIPFGAGHPGMEEWRRSGVYMAMPRTENTSPRPRRRTSLLLATAATILLLTVGVATAAATSSIEGIWSFTGGQIAIESNGNGTFKGTVVQPTRFATCTHEVGQEIWQDITPQPDGSYWGLHQWFKSDESTGACVVNPVPGPTAWRVLEEPDGAHKLLVCLSYPGSKQPTIPPGTSGVGATFGCRESLMTAPLANSAVGSFKEVVSLPSAKKCVSARKFAIHIHDPKYDPFETVVVRLRGHKLKVEHRGSTYTATVSLEGLPPGAFTLKVEAVTFRGHHLSGSRTYHTCVKKSKKAKPKKLK